MDLPDISTYLEDAEVNEETSECLLKMRNRTFKIPVDSITQKLFVYVKRSALNNPKDQDVKISTTPIRDYDWILVGRILL